MISAVDCTSLHRVQHLCNLLCAYTLYLLVSNVRYDLRFWVLVLQDQRLIDSTVNCLETDLPNLKINVGIDTIQIFSPKASVKHCGFGRDKAQRGKLPDYRGRLPGVVNCQSSTWPDPTRVSPRSPQGSKMGDPGNEAEYLTLATWTVGIIVNYFKTSPYMLLVTFTSNGQHLILQALQTTFVTIALGL